MPKLYFILLLFFVNEVANAQLQWAWMGGEQVPNTPGNYGTRGVASPSNSPSSRIGASQWIDKRGNLWLFGGARSSRNRGVYNDLWMYSTSSNQWTWISGEQDQNSHGNFGEKGVSSPDNQPPARQNAMSWTDSRGNFWLFGGVGSSGQDNEVGLLNDLWMYSTSSNQWTWVSGTHDLNSNGESGNQNESSPSNVPGARYMATGFVDANDHLWLFGGRGFSSRSRLSDLSDVWEYSPESNTWTWRSGSATRTQKAHYGEQGSFGENNTPGGRLGSTGWRDNQGNFWLFGGSSNNNMFCDLWKYDPGINQWAWISGGNKANRTPQFIDKGVPVPDPDGNPGSRTLAVGYVDASNNLWLFGGSGYGGRTGSNPMNMVWKYSISQRAWTYMNGESTTKPDPVYGTKGVSNRNNRPGGMSNSSGWLDQGGNFWVFGGESSEGSLNQLWKLSAAEGCTGVSGTISPASSSICKGGLQILTATGGTSYLWSLNGVPIAHHSDATLAATEPGVYSVIITNGDCTGPASNTAVVSVGTAPTGSISPAAVTICEGSSQVLTATGGNNYQWQRNGVPIDGQSLSTITVSDSGKYTVTITNGTCSGPASNAAIVTKIPAPNGSISPAQVAICNGGTQVLTATGGVAYQWMLDGVTLEGETSGTLQVNSGGTYSVIIDNGVCKARASNDAVVTIGAAAGVRYPTVTTSPSVPVQLFGRANGTSYEWTPPTGLDNPAAPNPKVTTSVDREYQVKITGIGDCAIVDTVLVKVGVETKVFVPTAFTPNNNNVNDRLKPLGNLSVIHYFRVYNRWGNQVFQTTTLGDGWDGRFNGVGQPADTYMWILSGKNTDGQPVKLSGKTLLIR